jgi:hypothetical protein
MKIKIGNWYLNDDDVEDPHLVVNINDATDKTQDEVNGFLSYFTDYEGESLFILSTRKWYEVYLKDIKII